MKVEFSLQQNQIKIKMEDGILSINMRRFLLIINCLLMSVGVCGGPLIMRLYFVEGGLRIWFNSWFHSQLYHQSSYISIDEKSKALKPSCIISHLKFLLHRLLLVLLRDLMLIFIREEGQNSPCQRLPFLSQLNLPSQRQGLTSQ